MPPPRPQLLEFDAQGKFIGEMGKNL